LQSKVAAPKHAAERQAAATSSGLRRQPRTARAGSIPVDPGVATRRAPSPAWGRAASHVAGFGATSALARKSMPRYAARLHAAENQIRRRVDRKIGAAQPDRTKAANGKRSVACAASPC
jgi:hypothetical protein